MAKKKDKEVEVVDVKDLELVPKEIIKMFGKNLFVPMEEFAAREVQSISTGSLRLDLALRNPFKPGISELSGQSSSGKTTLAIEVASNAQKLGMPVYYVAMERGLDSSLLEGIKQFDAKTSCYIPATTGNEALDIVEQLIRMKPGIFVIVDSVHSLVTEAEISKTSSEDTMGKLGSLLSKFLKKMVQVTDDNKSNILLINQLRDNLSYGAKFVTPGGRAIEYYSNLRLQISTNKADRFNDDKNRPIGHMMKVNIIKTRGCVGYQELEVPLLYGKGIFKELELLNVASELGIIDKAGAWYSIGNNKVQGQIAACELLSEQKVYDNIRGQVVELLK